MAQTNDGIYVSPLSGLIFRAGMEFKNWRDFWPYYAEAWLLGWPEKEIKWFKTADKDWAECSWAGGAGVGNYFDAKNPKVVINLQDIPQQTYEETPKYFDLAACAAGMKRGEEWLQGHAGGWFEFPTTSKVLYGGNKHIPEELLKILEARKAAEEAKKQPEPIPTEPQGMDFETAWSVTWEPGGELWFPWLDLSENVTCVSHRGPLAWVTCMAVADRFGGKPFYLTFEEARAHAEWLEFEAEKAELDRILEVKTNA